MIEIGDKFRIKGCDKVRECVEVREYSGAESGIIVYYMLDCNIMKSICLSMCEKIWEATTDAVNSPTHYKSHPSGVECIEITEHMTFCLGNAIKYIWRAGLKSDCKLQDLKKAEFYIKREIKRIEKDA